MSIVFETVLGIAETNQGELIAGKDGLHNLVKWCNVMEMKEPWKWVKSGEVLILSGVGLTNVTEELTTLLLQMDQVHAAGLFIQLGYSIDHINSTLIMLANKLRIPIATLPMEVNISNLLYRICQLLYVKEKQDITMEGTLREIMYLPYLKDMENALKYYGFLSGHPYVSIAVEIDSFPNQGTYETMDYRITRVRTFVLYMVNHLSYGNCSVLYTTEELLVSAIIPVDETPDYKEKLSYRLRQFMDQIKAQFGYTISIGIGCLFHHGKTYQRSSMEAKEALFMLHACHKSNELRFYEVMGIYRILFHCTEEKELRKIFNETLGPLMEYDQINGSELYNTLEVYLEEDCNSSKAAEALYIHRNTMKYRVSKIEEVLLCDLRDVNTCFNLRLGYKIKKFLGTVLRG